MMEQVEAVEIVRRMRGGSQSQLVRCSDGHHYIVKFQNNPQGRRVLVNEMIGTLLAKHLGLPIAEIAIVHVAKSLIRYTEDAFIQLQHGHIPCHHGSCFGSRFLGALPTDRDDDPRVCYDFMIDTRFSRINNLSDFLGMLVFDKWTSNVDDRQVLLVGMSAGGSLKAVMIDNGDCFNRSRWAFPDFPWSGLFLRAKVYSKVQSMEDFEPWLDRLERTTDIALMRRIGETVPPEWYGGDTASLERLLVGLQRRRTKVRQLLRHTLRDRPHEFPRLCSPEMEWRPGIPTAMALKYLHRSTAGYT
jgi:hypothetical protein